MRCYKMSYGSQHLIVSAYDASMIFTEAKSFDIGEKFEVEIIEMSDEELALLPEFDGFQENYMITPQEFVEKYKGRRVRADDGITGIVSHDAGFIYLWVLLDGKYTGDINFWDIYRPDELELIDDEAKI